MELEYFNYFLAVFETITLTKFISYSLYYIKINIKLQKKKKKQFLFVKKITFK